MTKQTVRDAAIDLLARHEAAHDVGHGYGAVSVNPQEVWQSRPDLRDLYTRRATQVVDLLDNAGLLRATPLGNGETSG